MEKQKFRSHWTCSIKDPTKNKWQYQGVPTNELNEDTIGVINPKNFELSHQDGIINFDERSSIYSSASRSESSASISNSSSYIGAMVSEQSDSNGSDLDFTRSSSSSSSNNGQIDTIF